MNTGTSTYWLGCLQRGQGVLTQCIETGKRVSIGLQLLEGEKTSPFSKRELGLLYLSAFPVD